MLFWPRARAFARVNWSCSEVKKSGLTHVSAPLVRLLRISAHVLWVSCAQGAFVFGRSILPDTDIGTAIVRECAVIGPSMNRQCATLARDFSMRQRISACAVLLLFGYLASSVAQVAAAPSKSDELSKGYEDGRLKLIVKAFADEIVRELSSKLDKGQVQILEEKLRKLPDHIQEHPAIGQKHLWVGKGKPPTPKDTERKERHAMAARRKFAMHKRDGALVLPSEEICQTTTQWEQLNRTQDYDGHEVEIVQDEIQQYVFSYRCATAQNPCTAISGLYDSECTERKGWMYLYYRPIEGENRVAKWGYVSVNHHCVCKVTPKGAR